MLQILLRGLPRQSDFIDKGMSPFHPWVMFSGASKVE